MINFGVIGPGHIAESFSAAAKKSKAKLYAVASRDIKKAIAFKNKYGFKVAYGDYESMMKDKKVDCVYIATPHSHHYEHMLMALKYNKHVICEKAFTVNAKQARHIFKIAKQKQLFVMEMTKIWFNPLYLELKRVIDKKTYGSIKKIEIYFERFLDPQKIDRIINPNLAGGALLDLGVYSISLVNMMLGAPDAISGKAKFYKTRVDHTHTLRFKYKNASAKLITSSNKEGKQEAIITLDKAIIKIPLFSRPEEVSVFNKQNKLLVSLKLAYKTNSLEHEIQEAIRCLDQKLLESPLLPHKQTIKIMEQMDTIRKSWNLKYPME